MTKLSIIIVNYNVKHFLDQCLKSVYRACENISHEIIVVDNVSVDGSQKFIKQHHPNVLFIENNKNVGFSIANNQAIKIAQGEYILLLNPDTVVGEKTFEKTVAFMDSHPDAGGLGIRMIDGKGIFLPESKRGLPTPWVSFYKIFGINKLFKKSKKFDQYYLGHLSDRENQEVDVLAGAFMLMRKEALDKVGLLDETFFMYGEDIDLAYRIQLGGYKNYYFAEDEIIHYKGESTKKGSMNYVFIFYQAMIIFAAKHFSKNYAKLFTGLIKAGIFLRGTLSIISRIAKKSFFQAIDISLIAIGLYYLTHYWEHNHRFIEGGHYPEIFRQYFLPGYSFLWVIGIALAGGYKRPVKGQKIVIGLVLGTIGLLTIYALSPENYRFSRAIILLGAAWAFFIVLASRFTLSLFPSFGVGWISKGQRRILIIAEGEDFQKLKFRAQSYGNKAEYIGQVSTQSSLGGAENLESLIQSLEITEVILSPKGLMYTDIIHQIDQLQKLDCGFYIGHSDRDWIIGSQSIHTQSTALGEKDFKISNSEGKRNKRAIDLVISIFLLILSPITLWHSKTKKLWSHLFSVALGLKTWVGYTAVDELPKTKPFVVDICPENLTEEQKLEVKKTYAQNYSINSDLRKILS